MKKSKKIIALLLAVMSILQIFSILPFAASAEVVSEVDTSFLNGEGVWLTEIYNNDVDRSETNDTRVSNGFEPIITYGTLKTDLMEFIEITSTHKDTISLNDMYTFYYKTTQLTVTDMSGNGNIQIKPGQTMVIWNYRSDKTGIPTEAEFRSEMRVPDSTVILKTVTGENWDDDSVTFKIKSTSKNKVISKFNAVKLATDGTGNTDNGFSVNLLLPDYDNLMEVYRKLAIPSPGYIYSGQLNGLMEPTPYTNRQTSTLLVTEIYADDINRSADYGTGSDLMECIEVYNTSDQAIDLNSDYQVVYATKEGNRKVLELHQHDTSYKYNVGSTSGCIVPAGGTAVLWCHRKSTLFDSSGNAEYTSFPSLKKFRAAHNIASDVPVYIFTNQASMANANRAIEIYKNESNGTKTLTSSYCYLGGGEDLNDGLSVQLQPVTDWKEMYILNANVTATPGTVDSKNQGRYHDDGSMMTVTLDEELPEYITQGEELRLDFAFDEGGKLESKYYSLYYRFDGSDTWYSKSEKKLWAPNYYEAIIAADEIYDHSYLEFYVEVDNRYRSGRSPLYRIKIKNLNEVDGIRTNINEGDELNGIVAVTANDGTTNANTKIYIDGSKKSTTKMLEGGAYLSFTAADRDKYFNNAITTTSNKLIADIDAWQKLTQDGRVVKIDSSLFTYNSSNDKYKITVRFWAGTRGALVEDTLMTSANRDDYTVTNLAMKLPNGNVYYPTKIGPDDSATSAKTNLSTDYSAVHNIGDANGSCPYMDVTFAIPASETPAVGINLDTGSLSNGSHKLYVTNGTAEQTVNFIADNSAPVINAGIKNGSTLTGNITISPQYSEEYTLAKTKVLLDDKKIETPYNTSAYKLGKGSHTLYVYAADKAGNTSEKTITFTVGDVSLSVKDGDAQNITGNSSSLYLTLDKVNADTTATFYQAEKVDVSKLTVENKSGILPHLQYTIDVGNVSDTDTIIANWDGTASNSNDTHATKMYVLNTSTEKWDLIATVDANGSIDKATFTAKDHVKDGKATIIVQCTADSALPDTDTTTDGIGTANDSWDGTGVPADYDFCFAWESDTQFYARGYQYHFLNMNQWLVDNAEKWKIKYLIHTGDIINNYDMMYQWENADEAMAILDNGGLPHGVLGGNHDVASSLDYDDIYTQYFGKSRYNTQPTYGGSFENNYGHYDLVSENGQDFIIVYMSWNIYEDEINWMNKILQKYSDRKAILCFHGNVRGTFASETATSLLDYTGELVQKYVIAKNPNVIATLNGHYHGSSYETVKFDDDGDGTKERTVFQLCTDYQEGEEGGMEYIKFLYFDLDGDMVYINSYSPYLNDFNYYDTPVVKVSGNGTTGVNTDCIKFKVDFDSTKHTITSNQFSAYVCRNNELGSATVDTSTKKASIDVSGLKPGTEYIWYATLSAADSGYTQSDFYEFTTNARTMGDVNNDGVISINDATLIQKILVKKVDHTEDNILYGDVDDSGYLGIRDTTLIQLYLSKIIDAFPSGL